MLELVAVTTVFCGSTAFLWPAAVCVFSAIRNGVSWDSSGAVRVSNSGSKSQFLIAFWGFGEMEGLGGGAFLLIQKLHMMGIAGGVDPDSDPDWVWGSVGSHNHLRGQRKENQTAVVRLLREGFDRKCS